MSSVPGHLLSPGNIAKKVFDEVNDAIRVSSPGITEVIIDAASGDNIAIMNSDGSPITPGNPLPVSATFTGGELSVQSTALDNYPDPGDIHDSIRIGDGVEELAINPDGSINAIVTPFVDFAPVYAFAEANTVAMGVETTIVSYTVPIGKTAKLTLSEMTGTNVATYNLYVGVTLVAKKHSFFGKLSSNMEFINNGYSLNSGEVITLKVIHERPFPGDFAANLQIKESL